MRIGLVGNDSSHAEKFVARWAGRHELLLAEATREPAELVKDPELAGAITVVDTAADLIGRIDGAVVGHRRALPHLAAAVPLLEAGIPTYVDKPLAASVADAAAIVDAAERGRTSVTSWSAVRWSAAATLATRLDLTRVTMEGPADPDSEYGGIAFYGVHLADLAVALLDGPVADVDVRVGDDQVVTELTVGGVPVTIVLRPPALAHGFRLFAESPQGTLDRAIELKPDYMNPVADIAEEQFATKLPLQTRQQLLDVVAITDAMDRAVTAQKERQA